MQVLIRISSVSDSGHCSSGFDCSNFQYQLKEAKKPFSNHIFQTIFLNKKHEDTWTRSEIRKDKIIREDWWHQLCHGWTHYAFVVPWMWLLNGKKHTTYAAAWTLVNAHELAIISGMAAAYTLGADYPEDLEKDDFATLCFKRESSRCSFLEIAMLNHSIPVVYLLLSHATIFKKGKNRDV